jgi:hypothetical protein
VTDRETARVEQCPPVRNGQALFAKVDPFDTERQIFG